MAGCSSILPWKIPWMGESGGLQSMGLQNLDMTERLSTHTHGRNSCPLECWHCYHWRGTKWRTFIDRNEKCSSKKKLSQSDASKETLRHMSWFMRERIKCCKMTQTFKGEWQCTTQQRWLFHIVSYMTEKKTGTIQTALDNFLKKWNTSILNASKVAQMVKNLPMMQETWVQSLGRDLAEEMATHSSIHARRIPRTKGPGRLQSMGPQGVRHDWVTNTHPDRYKFYIFFHFYIQLKQVARNSFHSPFYRPYYCAKQRLLVLSHSLSSLCQISTCHCNKNGIIIEVLWILLFLLHIYYFHVNKFKSTVNAKYTTDCVNIYTMFFLLRQHLNYCFCFMIMSSVIMCFLKVELLNQRVSVHIFSEFLKVMPIYTSSWSERELKTQIKRNPHQKLLLVIFLIFAIQSSKILLFIFFRLWDWTIFVFKQNKRRQKISILY